MWLLAGGVAYTVGMAFFVAKQIPYCHFVWHLFVMAGTTCHFVALWQHVIRTHVMIVGELRHRIKKQAVRGTTIRQTVFALLPLLAVFGAERLYHDVVESLLRIPLCAPVT